MAETPDGDLWPAELYSQVHTLIQTHTLPVACPPEQTSLKESDIGGNPGVKVEADNLRKKKMFLSGQGRTELRALGESGVTRKGSQSPDGRPGE